MNTGNWTPASSPSGFPVSTSYARIGCPSYPTTTTLPSPEIKFSRQVARGAFHAASRTPAAKSHTSTPSAYSLCQPRTVSRRLPSADSFTVPSHGSGWNLTAPPRPVSKSNGMTDAVVWCAVVTWRVPPRKATSTGYAPPQTPEPNSVCAAR